MLCDMELRVTSLVSVCPHNNRCSVLKLLLDQKHECDRRFKKIVTYIEEKGIKVLNLMEIHDILKEFPHNITYYYKYHIGCLIIALAAET